MTAVSLPARFRVAWASPRRRERLLQLGFLIPAIAYLAIFFGYPVIQNLVMSFQNYSTSTFYTGEAPWVGWDNYAKVLSSSTFARTMVNTAFFTVVSIAGQFVIGLAIANFFRRRFPGSTLLRSLLLLPWLVPLIVSSAIWKWMLDKDSGVVNQIVGAFTGGAVHPGWLTDTTLALITVTFVNIWLGIPFNVTIFYSGLQEIPQELYEASSLDGAVGRRAFWHITLPLLRPVITVVLVLGVVYTLKALDIILGLTNGGPAGATQTLSVLSYSFSFQEFNFGQGAAVGNILILISLVFAIFYLRANRRGIDE